jgi:hypothetical protein
LNRFEGGDAVPIQDILNRLNADIPAVQKYSQSELQAILLKMEEENKVSFPVQGLSHHSFFIDYVSRRRGACPLMIY